MSKCSLVQNGIGSMLVVINKKKFTILITGERFKRRLTFEGSYLLNYVVCFQI